MAENKADALLKLKSEMDARFEQISEQAPEALRRKIEANLKKPALGDKAITIEELAEKARHAVRDIEESRDKADSVAAEYEKLRSQFGEAGLFGGKTRSLKIPIWLAAILIGGFIAFLMYAANTHR